VTSRSATPLLSRSLEDRVDERQRHPRLIAEEDDRRVGPARAAQSRTRRRGLPQRVLAVHHRERATEPHAGEHEVGAATDDEDDVVAARAARRSAVIGPPRGSPPRRA